MRICNKCKSEYPQYDGYFQKHPYAKDGYEQICNKCRNERRRSDKNKVRHNIQQKKWRDKNGEKQLAYQAARRQDPMLRPIYKCASANTKAKKLGLNGRINKFDIFYHLDLQKGHCFYCDSLLTIHYEIDHKLPFSRGGDNTRENIVISCKRCNRSKWVFDDIKREPKRRKIKLLSNKSGASNE